MSVFRIYPEKENTIASGAFYENLNASQAIVSDIWYGGGVNNSVNSFSRHLVQFDLTELQNKIASFEINPNFVTSYTLNYTNSIPTNEALEPNILLKKNISSSFDLVFYDINKSWDEGRGGSLDNSILITFNNQSPLLTGYSNFLSATTFSSWDAPGIYSSPSGDSLYQFYQHFPIGSENINVDITSLVNYWLSGGTNNGLAFGYTEQFETISSDTKYIASFLTNKTNSAFKPYLQVNYNQAIKDDRHWVSNNRTSRLFLYLFSGNSEANFASAGTASIYSSSNSLIQSSITINQHSKGVYYIDILMTGTTKNQKFKDVWNDIYFSGSTNPVSFTNTFEIKDTYYNNGAKRTNEYVVDINGLANNSVLAAGEKYRIYADTRVSYSTQKPSVEFGLQYKISMGINMADVVSWTDMNTAIIDDCLSSYFDLDTSWLLDSQIYHIQFQIVEFGTTRILPDVLRFRVANPSL